MQQTEGTQPLYSHFIKKNSVATCILVADSSINQSQLEARICTCIQHQSVTGKRHGWIGFVSLYHYQILFFTTFGIYFFCFADGRC